MGKVVFGLTLALAGCDAPPGSEASAPAKPASKPNPEVQFDFDAEYAALWDAKAPALLRAPEKPPYPESEESRIAYLEGYRRAILQVLAARRVDRGTNFALPSTAKDRACIEGYKDGQAAGFEAERVILQETHDMQARKLRERHK